MDKLGHLIREMIAYYAGDVRRISHFLKVYGFAKTIGELECLDENTQEILELSALTHDIGIKNSEMKYGSSDGKFQQIEGPPEAKPLLEKLDISPAVIDRVCWLIAHHHSYSDINGLDYQILVESDFLVNIDEDNMSPESIQHVREKLFKTQAGINLLHAIYRF